jgi:hypothetical protein
MRTFADRYVPRSVVILVCSMLSKVNSEDLTKLYEYDAAMIDLADDARAVDNVSFNRQ